YLVGALQILRGERSFGHTESWRPDLAQQQLPGDPGKHPEESGGVHTWSPLAAKILADVHSATSSRSLSRITSSKPSDCASSSQVRFIAHARIFVPAKTDAAWRACRT